MITAAEGPIRTLVAYASPHGSTRGVAERITGRLQERGIQVSCLPVDGAADVAGYDAVIVGSAIHNRSWLLSAAQFIRTNRTPLAEKPTWLFSVGMPAALARPLRKWGMREGPKAVQEFVSLVNPRGDVLFSGVIEPAQLPVISRLILRMMGGRYGDFRDWHAIDAWADGIGAELTSHAGGKASVVSDRPLDRSRPAC